MKHNLPTDNSLIEWAGYKSVDWVGIDKLENPYFQEYLNEVKTKPELFQKFNLYLTGSILEDWTSWDADWVLTGPYFPAKIKRALDWITELGFKYGVYPDAVYVKEIFDLSEWQKTPNIQQISKMHTAAGRNHVPSFLTEQKWVYQLDNTFIKDGIEKDMGDGQWHDGLYRRWLTFPYQKNYDAILDGHLYKKALKIF